MADINVQTVIPLQNRYIIPGLSPAQYLKGCFDQGKCLKALVMLTYKGIYTFLSMLVKSDKNLLVVLEIFNKTV